MVAAWGTAVGLFGGTWRRRERSRRSTGGCRGDRGRPCLTQSLGFFLGREGILLGALVPLHQVAHDLVFQGEGLYPFVQSVQLRRGELLKGGSGEEVLGVERALGEGVGGVVAGEEVVGPAGAVELGLAADVIDLPFYSQQQRPVLVAPVEFGQL